MTDGFALDHLVMLAPDISAAAASVCPRLGLTPLPQRTMPDGTQWIGVPIGRGQYIDIGEGGNEPTFAVWVLRCNDALAFADRYALDVMQFDRDGSVAAHVVGYERALATGGAFPCVLTTYIEPPEVFTSPTRAIAQVVVGDPDRIVVSAGIALPAEVVTVDTAQPGVRAVEFEIDGRRVTL